LGLPVVWVLTPASAPPPFEDDVVGDDELLLVDLLLDFRLPALLRAFFAGGLDGFSFCTVLLVGGSYTF